MPVRSAFLGLMCMACLAAGEAKPGEVQDLKTPMGGHTYGLFIPDAYATDTTGRFPILFGFSNIANQMRAWANRNGVILFYVGIPADDDPADMYQAITSAAEQTLRIHPNLRFSAGMSAMGMRAWHMALAKPDQHAGVLCAAHSGSTSGLPPMLAKHICIAWNHGELDGVHPISATRGAIDAATANGNPVNWHFHPGHHTDGPYPESEKLLSWMLWTARLSHPRIPADERKGYQELLATRIAGLASEPPAARIAEFDGLLTIPGLRASATGKALLDAWATAHHERALALATPAEQHQALSELALLPDLKGQAMAKTVADELKELRKDPAIRKEHQAWQGLQNLRQQEAKLGAAKGKIQDLAKAYHALGQRFAGTLAAAEADAGAKRLAERAAER